VKRFLNGGGKKRKMGGSKVRSAGNEGVAPRPEIPMDGSRAKGTFFESLAERSCRKERRPRGAGGSGARPTIR